MDTKVCKDCEQELPTSLFAKRYGRQAGQLDSYCTPCKTLRRKNGRWADIDRVREYQREYRKTKGRYQKFRTKYGISKEQYESLLEDQNNSCAICCIDFDDLSKVRVDHCHKTNKVRGLLCHNCNVALGHLKDDLIVIARIIPYLGGKNGK